MVSPGHGALRVARALGLALAAYSLSLAAHLLGGGHAPSVLASAVLVSMTWWTCLMVTFRRLGRLAMVAVLCLSQVLLHSALSAAGAVPSCTAEPHRHAGHAGHNLLALCATPAQTVQSTAMSQHVHVSMAMTLGHIAAALLLGLVLARGEAAVWFLASLVWPAAPSPVPHTGPARWLPSPVERVLTGGVRPTGGVGRRGPPVGAAVAA